MKIKILILVLALSGIAFSQASRYDSQSWTTATISGTTGLVKTVPGAVVTVCTYPAATFGACVKAPLCPDNTGVGCLTANNPVTADSSGNFGWWIASGQYDYWITAFGVNAGPYHLATATPGVNGIVSLAGLGADTTCTNDTSAVFSTALATGKVIDLGNPSYCFKVTSQIAFTGKVRIEGHGATIKSDVQTFKFTDATGSRFKDVNFLPITTPYTVKRNPASWCGSPTTSATCAGLLAPAQSLEGYMPDSQDYEWPTWLANNPTLGTQFTAVHPGVYFTVSSTAGGSDVEISGITGRTANVILEGYSESRIHDNDFGSNGYTYGAILVLNGVPSRYNSTNPGFTFPRGVNNRIYNNTVKYATLCGIVIMGQDQFTWLGNDSSLNGESGFKTYAYDTQPGPSATSAVISTMGTIVGNRTYGNYYDGFDLSATYAPAALVYVYAGHTVTGNNSIQSRNTGFTTDGGNIAFTGNHAVSNGTHGFNVIGSGNSVINNVADGNCTTGVTSVPQCYDIVIEGDDATGIGNNIYSLTAVSTYNYLHAGVNGTPPTSSHTGIDFGNYSYGGNGTVFVDSTINGSLASLLMPSTTSIASGSYKINTNTVIPSTVTGSHGNASGVKIPLATNWSNTTGAPLCDDGNGNLTITACNPKGIVSTGTATFTLGGATIVGTGATVACQNVCDQFSGVFKITTGTAVSASGALGTINFPVTRANKPSCVFNLINDASGGVPTITHNYGASSTSVASVFTATVLASSNAHYLSYACGGG